MSAPPDSVFARALLTVAVTAALACGAAAQGVVVEGGSSAGGDSVSIGTADSTAASPADTCPRQVHVYYFHRTIRCQTCLTFEAYAREALNSRFADELSDGRLVWSVLNMEEQANGALVDEYDIFESSLVVSAVECGDELGWEKLEAIWGLVQDKSAFMSYVAAAVDSAFSADTGGTLRDAESTLPLHREFVPKSDG